MIENYQKLMMETVLITGGNGLIGRHLSARLLEKGYSVSVLGRSGGSQENLQYYKWDPAKNEIDEKAVLRADYVVHLAGANLGDRRWSEDRKKELIDSRIKTSELIFAKMRASGTNLKAFITASGIGYYGMITSERIFTETDPCSADFIGELACRWEAAADRFSKEGIRTVKIRTGVVLSAEGGALARMKAVAKSGLASGMGSGKQYLPWIHIDDLCNIYIKAICDNSMHGAYNAVAPEHVRNIDFMRTLARVLKRPFLAPNIPSILFRVIFGEMSAIMLEGSRVSSEKIRREGFSFKFPNLETALNDLLRTDSKKIAFGK